MKTAYTRAVELVTYHDYDFTELHAYAIGTADKLQPVDEFEYLDAIGAANGKARTISDTAHHHDEHGGYTVRRVCWTLE